MSSLQRDWHLQVNEPNSTSLISSFSKGVYILIAICVTAEVKKRASFVEAAVGFGPSANILR